MAGQRKRLASKTMKRKMGKEDSEKQKSYKQQEMLEAKMKKESTADDLREQSLIEINEKKVADKLSAVASKKAQKTKSLILARRAAANEKKSVKKASIKQSKVQDDTDDEEAELQNQSDSEESDLESLPSSGAEDESSAEDDFDLEEALRAERQEGGKKVKASKKRQAPEPSFSAASHDKGKKLAEKARRKAHVPEGDSSEEEDMFDTTKLVPYNQGVVYVGRIPHGFYEDQMRGFFSQFGRVVNLRVSRSKKSGKSKHYAFVQFETPVVADIVAQAMDNYLMFHRIVKCKLMAPEDVHPQIWKGANTVYRPVDTSKKAALLHNRTDATPDSLQRRVSRLKRQDQKLRAHLALKGIHYDLPPFDSEDSPAPKKQRTAAGSKSLDAQPKSDKSDSKFFKKSAPEVASPNSSSKKTVASLTSKTPSSSTSKVVSKTSTSKTAVAEVPKSKSKVAAVVPKPKAAAGTKPKPVTAIPDVSEAAKPKSRSVADLTKLKSAAKAPATTPSLIKTRKRMDTPDPRRR